MCILKTPNTTILTILLLYITSNCVVKSTNATLDISKNNSVSNVAAKDTEKPSAPTNITIIPGPNLVNHSPDIKLKEVSNVSTLQTATRTEQNNVVSEGGGDISNLNLPVNKPVPSAVTPKLNAQHTSPAIPSNIIADSKPIPSTLMEGGGKPETLTNHNVSSTTQHEIISQNSSASTTPQHTIPVSETAEGVRQKIAPRKGVNNVEYSEFKKTEIATTVKTTVKKPSFTEASEDEPTSAIHSEDSKDNLTTRAELLKPKVPSLDRFNEFSNNTQQYVIPIVIVILSVPLVTIVISFLLKRGAEWWKYRHYRRMDFLINGIYDA